MKKLVPLLLLAVLFLAGCYPGGPITITGPSQLPAINSFNASPASISAGESSNLSWTVTSASTVSIDQGIGNVALTGTRAVAPAATTIYTLTASSSAGSVTATTQVIVSGAPPSTGLPVINSFIASPSSITVGGSTSLSWNVSNATSVTIDNGVGPVGSSGNTIVLPSTTTTYTLTASNTAGSTPATTQVIVSGAPYGGPPVINYFTAGPPIIPGGGSTTLSWNVSNASSVSIDNGIGPVSSSGTILVTMSSSTNFILTATNSYGPVYLALPVMVTGVPPPVGAPDLVITSIDRVETPEGYKINYTIKNQGTATAGASTTKLYASTVYKASDPVGLLVAGASETKQFTGWVFNPTTPIIKIVADADGAVVEADETNNEKQLNYAVQILYNFVDNAGGASVIWKSGSPLTDLSFGGSGSNGSASYVTSAVMEDGSSYGKVLATHPKWVNDGYIYGYYPIAHLVKPGEHFVAKVGLIKGASAGNVIFEASYREAGIYGPVTLLKSLIDSYDGNLKTIDVPLPPESFGKQVNFYLQVKTNGPSNQDWAAWVEARIIR
jgi:hypothetical protein